MGADSTGESPGKLAKRGCMCASPPCVADGAAAVRGSVIGGWDHSHGLTPQLVSIVIPGFVADGLQETGYILVFFVLDALENI